ncbi:WD40/YVTN/BNR-like repeat-containing protein [Marinobacter sp. VGCF2001]|uniref:WD40/YVTN/BNR-like repeat-containing protein n=1 Tax=Marinobacter sp. VGCF2001 TaxID=3417189 RepID=UPI003CE8D724
MTATPDLSRRSFFGRLAGHLDPSGPSVANWYQVPDVSGGDGDVFWTGWCGNGEVFVAGDNGRIVHLCTGPEAASKGWETMPVPVTTPIHGLWGRDSQDLFAVGWMGTLLHYNGRQWTLIQGAVVDHEQERYQACAENTPLFAIDGQPDGRAWAVGDEGRILHLDGDTWANEHSGVADNLRAVACAGNGIVYAAGLDGRVLKRSRDGLWHSLGCPFNCGFQAVLPLGEDELILAGGRYFVDKGGFRGELVHYANGEFHLLHQDVDMPRLRALKHYKNGILMVADRGQLFYRKDNAITHLACDSQHDLMDIVTMPSGEALIVGDFGTVMTAAPGFIKALADDRNSRDPGQSQWQTVKSPTRHQLWCVWQDDQGTTWAGGEAGTVLKTENGEWQALPTIPEGLAVHCLWGCPGAGLFAGGQQGKIYRFDGTNWQLHYDLHLDLTILGLWGAGPDCIYAVGDEGLILHFDGLRWQRVTSGTQSALYDIWAYDEQHMLVVGDFGLILRYNGKDWKSFNADSEQFLYGVWGANLTDIWVVGLSGTATHFDGARWQCAPTRLRDDLMAIDGSGERVVAVGTHGCAAILHNGQWHAEATPISAGLRAVCVGSAGEAFAVGDQGTILKRLPS